MAYLFQVILLILAAVILLLPISFKLSLNKGINLTASIPFLDIRILPAEKKRKTRKIKLRKRFNAFFRTAKALRRSFDIFLKRSRLTVFESNGGEKLQKSISSKGKSILFSLFLSYLASKSGIVITDENSRKDDGYVFTSALIDTRAYAVIISALAFAIMRYFPKKEQGIVR